MHILVEKITRLIFRREQSIVSVGAADRERERTVVELELAHLETLACIIRTVSDDVSRRLPT